jgi:hypothetical protein
MKPRNREINIFNMSLLDILCGALGAFCFLMLVLFPFYSLDKGVGKAPEVPPGVDPKTYEDAMKRIKELEDVVKKFQEYGSQMDAEVKRLQAENNQLKAENKDLREKVGQLQMRNPVLCVARFDSREDTFELFVEDDFQNGGKKSERVDPTRPQGPHWTGDRAGNGGGLAYFLIRDTPPGEYRVYLKILKHNPAGPPMQGYVGVQMTEKLDVTPNIFLTQAEAAIQIAAITVDKDYKQSVRWTFPKEMTAPPANTNK